MKTDLRYYRIYRLAARMGKAPKIRVIFRNFKSSVRWNKFMKTIILLLITATTFGQGVYVSVGATNKGAQFAAGYENGVRVELSHKKPFTKNDVATITAITAGYRFNFITPSIGLANTKVKDFAHNPDGNEIKAVKMTYSVSFDYTIFFVNINYCDGGYYGAGLRVYFSRL